MDVSVIIPTLNEEKRIVRCIKAVRAQKTELKYEVIVSDGHSKDKTVEVAKKYADKVVLSRQKGIAGGRNTGASVAKGDVLCFIDADTIVPSNYIGSIYYALQNKEISGLSTGFRFSSRRADIKAYEEASNLFYLYSSIKGDGKLTGFNTSVRKETFAKVNGFPQRLLEDWFFSESLKKFGKVVFLQEPTVITSSRREEKEGAIGAYAYYLKILFQDTATDVIEKAKIGKRKGKTGLRALGLK